MTDTALLNARIKEIGLKKSKIASILGITCETLSRKVHNKQQFKAEEITVLCDILRIDNLAVKDTIFFAREVHK